MRPVILAGHGVRMSGHMDAFLERINDLGLPVVTTPMAADLLPYDHHLFIGRVGIRGHRAGNFAVSAATHIYAVGTSLHPSITGYDTESFFRGKEVVRLSAFEFLDHKTEPENVYGWISRCLHWQYKYQPEPRKDLGFDVYEAIRALSDEAQEGDIIIADAGSAYYVTGQAWRTKRNQRVLLPGALAQMGWAIPAATGAAFANPKARVICIVGDGSFMTNVHELSVIAHHKLNVTIVVLDNSGYSCIKNTQANYFGGNFSGTDRASGVHIPHVVPIAASMGIHLGKNVHEGLNEKGPKLVWLPCSKEQPFYPMVTSTKLANGSMRSDPLWDMSPKLSREELKITIPEVFA